MGDPLYRPERPTDPAFETPARTTSDCAWVRSLHTLGPAGTNCERAALLWRTNRCPNAWVELHPTLEAAADAVLGRNDAVLVGVAAYPQLHTLIYSRIERLQILEAFIMDTDEMVLASSSGALPKVCATHPAPEHLLPPSIERRYVASNVLAAQDCVSGQADGCVTTLCAARVHGLSVLHNYGCIPMAFTIHGPRSVRPFASFAAAASDVATAPAAIHPL
ncbi:prephenate dehydratase [Stappia sp. TSB10P1A]|uniref:prephenate dehydratase n=1 Tax=Stappia sp. TSB10P1A TaxID=2003585 RepID=UPI001643C0BA|nr:prephenate dehydratase [Stappia sp. TSB10P1A]